VPFTYENTPSARSKKMSEKLIFKTGAIVRLKSGGPDMTVSDPSVPSSPGRVRCQWFSGRKMESGMFPGESLVAVSDSLGAT
jgi:uncharacterized protein YodC (DUF2158 family)